MNSKHLVNSDVHRVAGCRVDSVFADEGKYVAVVNYNPCTSLNQKDCWLKYADEL